MHPDSEKTTTDGSTMRVYEGVLNTVADRQLMLIRFFYQIGKFQVHLEMSCPTPMYTINGIMVVLLMDIQEG